MKNMVEIKPGIYCIINKVNQKLYIGSSGNIKKRRKEHFVCLNGNYHSNLYLQSSFNKYGKENFEFKVLKYCKEKDLLKYEQYYMNKFQSTNPHCGYNMAIKSDRSVMDENTKKKISLKLNGIKRSKETREKMSRASKLRRHTKESKIKIGLASKGRKASIETKEKLRRTSLGRKHTKETKEKLSKIMSGKNHPLWGKKFSEEHKQKIGDAQRGKKHHAWGKKFSEEHKEKLRKAKLGKKLSDNHKKNMSIAQKKRRENERKKEVI